MPKEGNPVPSGGGGETKGVASLEEEINLLPQLLFQLLSSQKTVIDAKTEISYKNIYF